LELDPSHILQVGSGFWASKTLLSAVELDLFSHLSSGEATGEEIRQALRLHPRAVPDFLDALVALRLLDRQGRGEPARYSNTAETVAFLDKASPDYLGGFLEMLNDRLYRF
jgi:predicted transcriptional regulator